MRFPLTPTRPRRGTAAVELAVIIPFLLTASYGMIEVSRAIQVKHYLTDAARSGCRVAITPAATTAQVKANVLDVIDNYGINTKDVTVTVTVNGKAVDAKTAVTGDKMSVAVSLPVTKVNWVAPMIFSGSAVESETLAMMRQR